MNDVSACTKGPQRAPSPVPPAEDSGRRRDTAGTLAFGYEKRTSAWCSVPAKGAPSLQLGKLSLTEVNGLREAKPRIVKLTSPTFCT